MQRAVHRAFVGDLQQPFALLRIEGALDRDVALDLIEHALARFTLLAVAATWLGMAVREDETLR